MKLRDKIIVVTGGGSGMGRELVLQLLERGARVAMADLNEASMTETRELAKVDGDRLSQHALNIADRDAVMALPEAVIAAHGAVDGVINNAGIIQPFVRVNELDFDRIERVMNVNFFGTLNMVKAFLPHLLKRPEGHIANVSSMGGLFPFPGQTIYGASKAAVKLLTEGLYAELMETNVRVSGIYPGAVATHITENSGVKTPAQADEKQGSMKPLPAKDAAKIMLDGIERDRYRILVGNDARVLDGLSRIAPERAARFVAKQMKSMLD